MTDFDAFQSDVAPEIATVSAMLQTELSDNPVTLSEQVRAIESWYGRFMFLLADADSMLDLAEQERKPPRGGKDFTDLDREIELAARVAPERKLRDRISGLADAIRQRVILAQSLLKAERSESGRHQT